MSYRIFTLHRSFIGTIILPRGKRIDTKRYATRGEVRREIARLTSKLS